VFLLIDVNVAMLKPMMNFYICKRHAPQFKTILLSCGGTRQGDNIFFFLENESKVSPTNIRERKQREFNKPFIVEGVIYVLL